MGGGKYLKTNINREEHESMAIMKDLGNGAQKKKGCSYPQEAFA